MRPQGVEQSGGRITRYAEDRSRIARFTEIAVQKPEPAHRGWENFVSQRSVRVIAVAPRSSALWLATWGGVLEWQRKDQDLCRRHAAEHGLAGNAVSCLVP